MWLFKYLLCLNLTEIPAGTPDPIKDAIIKIYFENSRVQYFMASFIIGIISSAIVLVLLFKGQSSICFITIVRQI